MLIISSSTKHKTNAKWDFFKKASITYIMSLLILALLIVLKEYIIIDETSESAKSFIDTAQLPTF